MPDEHPSKRKRNIPPHEVEPDVGGFIGEDGVDYDADRHYHGDPNHIAEFGADADEKSLDEALEIDQVELQELGLVLDDPHQPLPD